MNKISWTFFFNEVFESYDDFKNFIEEQSNTYSADVDENFLRFTWNILAREFSYRDIAYSDKETFKDSFLNVFDDKFLQFKNQKSKVDKIYNLTDAEVLEIQNALTSSANAPESYVEDMGTQLGYISNQAYNTVSGGRLQGYLNALNNLPTFKIRDFLYKGDISFNDLFVKASPNIQYLYREENE